VLAQAHCAHDCSLLAWGGAPGAGELGGDLGANLLEVFDQLIDAGAAQQELAGSSTTGASGAEPARISQNDVVADDLVTDAASAEVLCPAQPIWRGSSPGDPRHDRREHPRRLDQPDGANAAARPSARTRRSPRSARGVRRARRHMRSRCSRTPAGGMVGSMRA
jgi:hypothetical protein